MHWARYVYVERASRNLPGYILHYAHFCGKKRNLKFVVRFVSASGHNPQFFKITPAIWSNASGISLAFFLQMSHFWLLYDKQMVNPDSDIHRDLWLH